MLLRTIQHAPMVPLSHKERRTTDLRTSESLGNVSISISLIDDVIANTSFSGERYSDTPAICKQPLRLWP